MARHGNGAAQEMIGAAVAVGILLAGSLSFSCMRRGTLTQAPSDATLPGGEPREVRVVLVDGATSARIAVSAPYTIAPSGGLAKGAPRVVAQGPSLGDTTVSVVAAALAIGARHFPDDELLLTAAQDGAVAVNGSHYRGKLFLRRAPGDRLTILNILPVDHYLYSVLGSETYASWPAAALEAQAVVARSYAMWRMAERRDEPFDLHATVMDQNYLGVAKEDPRLRAAVDRTAGAVLLYQMKLFRCYYHSTCGGHTEAVENAFPDPPLLPLSAVPCRYCTASKHYQWERRIPKTELADALRRNGLTLRRLASVEVAVRTAAGRARTVTLRDGERAGATLAASEFRLAVGASRLPSTCFELEDQGAAVRFAGRGWGHGVGMCQWGSKGMAEAGHAAEEILEHYYPGARLVRLYEGRGT